LTAIYNYSRLTKSLTHFEAFTQRISRHHSLSAKGLSAQKHKIMLNALAFISIISASLKPSNEVNFLSSFQITNSQQIQQTLITITDSQKENAQESTGETFKLSVPYVNQKENLIGTKYEEIGGSACGPATIAMALQYNNEKTSLETVIDTLPDTVYAKGKMFYDLNSGPEYFGYTAIPLEINMEQIHKTLKNAHPILMNVQNYDGITGHEILVVGMKNYDSTTKTAEAIIVHDPFREAYREFKILNNNTLQQPEGYTLPIGILKPFYIIKTTLASTNVVK
jgi:hypothetical protein